MRLGSVLSLVLAIAFAPMAVFDARAEGLADPDRAKAANKCQIILERTGTHSAHEKLDALQDCIAPISKCVQTKPGDAECLDRARNTCEEQLELVAAEDARMVDVVARKCASDVTVEDLLDPLGLAFVTLKDECKEEFDVDIGDVQSVGVCLARQHACEIERMFSLEVPRAASLLALAGVDPALRSGLACLAPLGGSGESTGDPRGLGRQVEKCARTIMTAGGKLVDASLKALGKCLDVTFTCVEVKTDPSQLPACLKRATSRCDLEFANLDSAAGRPGVALQKTCGDVDFAVLRDASGLLLEALATDCRLLGGTDPTTLDAYADCLVRSHRCGVAELSRFTAPRAEELLREVGRSLNAICPVPTPTPTATPSPTATTTPLPGATVTDAPPVVTPTVTSTPIPTVTAPPNCEDTFEPNTFPNGKSLNEQCTDSACTDDGYELDVKATINPSTDDDFYVWDVSDLERHDFQIIAQLKDVPKGTNYDLYLYRRNGDVFEEVGVSDNDGNANETIRYDGVDIDGANSGQYGIEVRPVAGSSCSTYTLEVQDGN